MRGRSPPGERSATPLPYEMAQRAEQAATPATPVRELRGATRQPSLERLGERAHCWLTIRGVAG